MGSQRSDWCRGGTATIAWELSWKKLLLRMHAYALRAAKHHQQQQRHFTNLTLQLHLRLCRPTHSHQQRMRMTPGTVEATLQQLNLAAPDSQQQQQQQLEETPAALQNTACLAATFSWLDDERSLLRCSAVCQLWASVLQGQDIWRQVYLRHLPPPLPHERASRCGAAVGVGSVGDHHWGGVWSRVCFVSFST